MSAANFVGERGEALAYARLTDYQGLPRPLFRPYFLGARAQTIDYLIELEGVSQPFTPYFFVQVKATAQVGRQPGRNLRVKVSLKDSALLVRYPAPTYILGIEERTGQGFIFAVTAGTTKALSSLPTRHQMTIPTLQALHDEVLRFWQASGAAFTTSRFV